MQDTYYNKLMAEDETMLALYPKIKGIPDNKRKELYKTELSKLVQANNKQDSSLRKTQKDLIKRERAEFNTLAEKAVREEKQEIDVKRKDLLMRNLDTQKTQI